MVVVNKKPTKDQKVAELLRQLTRVYVGMQKHRKKFVSYFNDKLLAGYLSANMDFEEFMEKQIKEHAKVFANTEKRLEKDIAKHAPEHPWYEYLADIDGISSRISSGIVGELCGAVYNSIEKDDKKEDGERPKPKLLGYGRKFNTVSSLWKYSGYAVDKNGKGDSRRSGGKESWNHYLKYWLYHFGECQIKAIGPYKKVYDKRRAYEDKKYPKLSRLHRYSRARRYMIKEFLKDVYNDLLVDGKAMIK